MQILVRFLCLIVTASCAIGQLNAGGCRSNAVNHAPHYWAQHGKIGGLYHKGKVPNSTIIETPIDPGFIEPEIGLELGEVEQKRSKLMALKSLTFKLLPKAAVVLGTVATAVVVVVVAKKFLESRNVHEDDVRTPLISLSVTPASSFNVTPLNTPRANAENGGEADMIDANPESPFLQRRQQEKSRGLADLVEDRSFGEVKSTLQAKYGDTKPLDINMSIGNPSPSGSGFTQSFIPPYGVVPVRREERVQTKGPRPQVPQIPRKTPSLRGRLPLPKPQPQLRPTGTSWFNGRAIARAVRLLRK